MAIKPLHNETELLSRIAAGDQRAFKELFDGYFQPLGEYLFKLTGSLDVSQDIVQDTFIKVWLKRQTITGVQNFSSYVFILSRNKAYNELRRQARERDRLVPLDEELEGISDDEPSPSAEYRELIDTAIDRLPPQAQKVYLLSRDQRMKHEEIAIALNISAETVKKHIQYATKFITKEVQSKMNIAVVGVLLTPLMLS